MSNPSIRKTEVKLETSGERYYNIFSENFNILYGPVYMSPVCSPF